MLAMDSGGKVDSSGVDTGQASMNFLSPSRIESVYFPS